MTTKKPYEAPEMKIYQVQKANIIATSGPLNSNDVQFQDYQDGEFSW